MKSTRLLLLLFFTALLSQAYVVDKDESNIYVTAWDPGSITFKTLLPNPSSSLIDGTTYISSVEAAMAAWNAQLGSVQMISQATITPANPPSGTYASGNGINEIALDSQYNSGSTRSDFGTNTLAVTVTYTSGNARVESDVVFNSGRTWDSYRGGLRSGSQDIRRVAIHELGHTLGLGHPDQSSQTVSAIMNSTVSSIDALTTDDIDGGQLLYGSFGFIPPNDTFASATQILLSTNTAQLIGTNINATRQSGEPFFAGANAPNGHSVWWKWTPTSSGSATFTTLGSNFDTTISVFTGSAVNTLTRISDDDDVQDGVVRTSEVTVNAASGTTYFIAVDGWGSTSGGDIHTYTGRITLNLSFSGTISNVAPTFTTHPSSQSVTGGLSVNFSVFATGVPVPTYQWRRNGVNITGATAPTYAITSTQASDAGTYTVIASNSAGSVTSNSATLTLTVPTTFDVAGYYARNNDIATAFGSDTLGAWLHFYSFGLNEGRQYDSQFIVEEYLLLNTDLTNAFGSDKQAALLHWLTWGKPIEDRIGRVPIGFNVDSYLGRYPDLAAAFGSITPRAQRNVTVWNHYLDWGVREGRSDGDFEAYNYLATNSDLAAVFGTDVEAAALHWYFYGRREGRRIPSNFDVAGYRTRNPDIVVVWGNDKYGSWLHYRDTGVYEGRVYDDLFRVLEYRARYSDVQAAYGNDLTGVLNHWLFYGKPEGRLGRNP